MKLFHHYNTSDGDGGRIMNEKLGIVVPAYNRSEHISQCIESILGQTYTNIVLAVVDDGSTDDTLSIARKYEGMHRNMLVISQENSGPIKARFAGIKALEDCEYITFVDSDDWIDERMYEDLMSLMLQYDSDLVCSGIFRYYHDDYIIEQHDKMEQGYINLKSGDKSVVDFFGYRDRKNDTSVDASLCTKIFRREKIMEVYKKAENLKIHYGDDAAIIFPYIMLCESVYCTHRAYYYHRMRKGSAYYVKVEDYFEKLLRFYNHLRECFKEDKVHFPELLEELDYCFVHGAEVRKTLYETSSGSGNHYLFPFGKVNRGENIVIYGMGKVGKGYVEQLHKTNYCNVAAVVDRYSEAADLHTLTDIKELEFDHVVIAIADINMKRQIAEDMICICGIPTEKIIDEIICI